MVDAIARVSGSRGSLPITSASFQVEAFTVLPATLLAPLVPPVADKAAISHPGASSSASLATKQPVLPEAASSMAEGNVLLTPTPAWVSSDVLIEEIALAAPEVTKPVAMLADANQHTWPQEHTCQRDIGRQIPKWP